MRYAQMNENNICFADSFLSGEVIGTDMILLSEDEPSPLGKRYVNGVWEEVEKEPLPEQEVQPTNKEILDSIQELKEGTVPMAMYKSMVQAGAEMAVTMEGVLPPRAGVFTEGFPQWQADGMLQETYSVVQYGGMAYQCINGIQRFEQYAPDIATNNYNPYPTPDEKGVYPYVEGMGVAVGMLEKDPNGKVYKAIQAMTKQLNSPSALPAIFTEVVV